MKSKIAFSLAALMMFAPLSVFASSDQGQEQIIEAVGEVPNSDMENVESALMDMGNEPTGDDVVELMDGEAPDTDPEVVVIEDGSESGK